MRRMSHIPLRLTTGAFILNAGYGKRNLDKDSAAGLRAMAARVIRRYCEAHGDAP